MFHKKRISKKNKTSLLYSSNLLPIQNYDAWHFIESFVEIVLPYMKTIHGHGTLKLRPSMIHTHITIIQTLQPERLS
jgi:hypothetical protein